MKKSIVFVVVAFFIICGICFADDSTVTPSGTAIQPDIDQQGSDIIGVGNLEARSMEVDSAIVNNTIYSNNITNTNTVYTSNVSVKGAVYTKNVSASGTVSANILSAPSGAITSLNTDRTYVSRTPTSTIDATNKKYVDSQYSILSSKITQLETLVNNLSSGLSGYEIRSNSISNRGHYTVSVNCSAGKVVTGGGCYQSTSNSTAISFNYPVDNNTWACRTRDIDSQTTRQTTVYAICVSQ